MLIRFSVSNYLSFNETQEFSTITGRVRAKNEHVVRDGKLGLLKFSALYGANASGKSNLVSAIELSKSIILGRTIAGTARDYHRIIPENKDKPTSFEYEIKIKEKCYAYGFDIILSGSKIVGEWLYEIGLGKKDNLIFKREPTNESERFSIGAKYETSDFQTYIRGMEKNTDTLFLPEMNRNKQDFYERNPKLSQLVDVFRWFAQKLSVTQAGLPLPSKPFYIRDDFDIAIANKIIPALGLGIKEINIVEEDMATVRSVIPQDGFANLIEDVKNYISQSNLVTGQRPKSMSVLIGANRQFFILTIDTGTFEVSAKSLRFTHDGSDTLFTLSEESEGTRRMLELVEILFAAYNCSDNVYVIDEIDRSLHPLLTYKLIELYLSLATKGRMQLIVTTHESHIMDLNLLRRDEIWLINKTSAGNSEIYSLDQFTVRFDKKVSKAYMDGRYGGVPILDNFNPIINGPR